MKSNTVNQEIESAQNVGASLDSLGVKEVVGEFPQGNDGEGRNKARSYIKSRGVSFK